MNARKDGGAAFPMVSNEDTDDMNYFRITGGMSLRDYFAAQALAGVCSDTIRLQRIIELRNDGEAPEQAVGRACYEMADAMLAERAK